MSLVQTARVVGGVARISVAALSRSARGRLTPEYCDERLAAWARDTVRDARIDLVIRGAEHAAGSDPLIVMSNHQSHYDVPMLYASIPGRLRMVAKAELFKIPVWGHAMHAAGFVRVDRTDRAQAVESLRAATEMLSDGTRLWIAPEGTRSPTGELGPFKSGGFRMAIDTGTAILPVAIRGTREILPPHSLVVQTGKRVVVTILPRIDPRPYGLEGRKRLMEDVRAAIANAMS